MIVDDAMFMRVTLKNMLEKNGYLVVGDASNGVEAIEKYKELQPDLVTMDITMPEMEGTEATEHIKKFDPQAKIIMISAMGQQAKVVEAVRAGAVDFIVKPYQEEHVIKTLEKYA
ncbi:response regulator (plasmid) [Aneurinibacillus sp. Ricciae_BoGa-3]|uniref:response regulator n=1 Tax=Aneurinibacillus sp. Ricciae_BoGa-3 TaxID=3022697 RepID=UPI00233F96CD|nr:response regulator [Aneurinibacillus sp. Ricciae_BoGa-3]WCK57776.1 response regulator [Aneurinibacillus sp. Ricciae_BoGa-3]